ncbi:hypothetical protein CPC16_007136 [Podila verticillata]|nr:hypothetical protein BGZ59_000981 [Podila verticillata]KAF9387277.1 hypothetical protein CPC16_007136 [Podila verticillata]KFH65054.1 hypothetical protein MVEG_08535 [Podila verticillata NRRL 6337]
MKITAILSALAAASLVSAGKFIPLAENKPNHVSGAFIIEYEDGVDHSKASNYLNSHKVNYKVRGEFNVFNGASFDVKSGHTGEDLAKIPGVKRVWPVEIFTIGKPKTVKGDPVKALLTSAHTMTGADYVQKTLKFTGKGVKVGIVDSGVDYTHPALGGCFGKGCRVRYGWDFVGDDVKNAKSDSDPIDKCHGHGTHVAGIVGADARKVGAPHPFVGVAPEVTFGAYRVLDCNGSGSNEGVMFGMELAFNQGMHVINMSLGGGSAYKSNPVAVLADKLSAHGMAVIAAAGNDGADGVGMVSDGGLGDLSISVASFDNVAGFYNYFKYAGAEHPYSPSEAWGKAISLPASATLVPVFNKDGTLSDGCLPANYPATVKGKVVLVLGDFTNCGSKGRGDAALAAGAAGMLIQSTPFGLAGLTGAAGLPTGAIEFGAGEALLAAVKKTPAGAFTWAAAQKSFKVEGGGTPSSFSSYGLDGELRIKPDIAAPGGNIYSTYPTNHGSYAILSGTSMATPYTTGSQALLYNAHKRIIKAVDARRILKATATPGKNFKGKSPASVAKQGAGLINIKNAVAVQAIVSPEHIQLLDTVHFAGKSVEVKIKNTGKKTATYVFSHEAAESLVSYRGGNTFPLLTPVIQQDAAKVKFSASKVTIKPGQIGRVKVQFSEPSTGKAAEFPLYSGYIVATPNGKGAIPLRVPYAGIKGDVAKIPIMDTSIGAPIASANANEIAPGQKLTSADSVNFILRLGSHSPDVRITLVEKASGKSLGYVATSQGAAWGPFGRNTNVNSAGDNYDLFVLDWIVGKVFPDKTSTTAVTAPAGAYKLVISAQHKLSKGNYPADFEVYEVADITL